MAIKPSYSIDTSSLIHAWRRAYPPSNFPLFWKYLAALGEDGRLSSSSEVLRELKKKDDEVYEWCKRRSGLFVPIDEAQQTHVSEIMAAYPRLVDTSTGRSTADPFVIAVARMNNPRHIVVSEENKGRNNSPKMPDVCAAEGIQCIRLVNLIEAENWVFR